MPDASGLAYRGPPVRDVGGLITIAGPFSRLVRSVSSFNDNSGIRPPFRGGEDARQRRRIEWLHQVAVEPGVERLAPVFLGAVAAERDEVDVAHAQVAAHAARDFVPTQSGQPNVEEHDLGPILRRRLERRGAVMLPARLLTEELQHHLERFGRIEIVVDDQHAPRNPGRRRRRVRRGFVRALRYELAAHRAWQPDRECAALAEAFAVGLDGSAVALDQGPHQREADAQALARALGRVVDLDEKIPYVRKPVARDADAVIAHAHHDAAKLALGAYLDTPAGVGVFHGFEQADLEDLLQPHAIGDRVERLLWQVHHELVASGFERSLARLEGVADLARDVERLAPELGRAARDARDVEQVLDEPRHLRDLPVHRFEQDALALGIDVFRPQHVQRRPQRRERVAQLV